MRVSRLLHDVIAELRAALAASERRADAAEARADAERKEKELARAETARVREQLDELLQLAATQSTHLADLRTMLRRRMTQRKRSGTESSIVDPEEDTVKAGTTPAEPTADSNPANPSPPARTRRLRKPRAKGTGRRPLPKHLPSVAYTGEVSCCGNCGKDDRLAARDEEHRARIDAAETIVRIRREVLEVVRCKRCGKTTTAEPPSLP